MKLLGEFPLMKQDFVKSLQNNNKLKHLHFAVCDQQPVMLLN